MSPRNRFMSPREFGALIADLRLAPNIFQDSLLEFLERQRIVMPVVRVSWPESMVLEGHKVVSDTAPTQEEREASQELNDALRLWRRFDADPEQIHPFDLGAGAPGAALISSDVSKHPFIEWSQFRTNIRNPGQPPLYVTDGFDTYYHDWQALLVADALNMGLTLIFDTRQPELLNLATSGRLADIPENLTYRVTPLTGLRGLERGTEWAPYFDAAAKVETVRARTLTALVRNHKGHIFTLNDAELTDLNAAQKRGAERALAAIDATQESLRLFLIYLCERWEEWNRSGWNEVAAEYKRQIGLTLRMAIHAFDTTFEKLSAEVGRATNHFTNTLDIIFPDWKQDARDKAELSLKHSVVSKAPAAGTSFALDDEAATDLLNWLERNNQWKVHLSIETILEKQFSASAIDHSALAKEVESLSATFEHLTNALLEEAGISSSETLMKKMQLLWNASSKVHGILATQFSLVSTKTVPRVERLASIAALASVDSHIDVARTLLAAVLYRNDGLHNGMSSWTNTELVEATRIFLTAMMFCRKNLLISPPTCPTA